MRSFAVFILCITGQYCCQAQQVPDGYILQYHQDFSLNKALEDFWFNHPSRWGLFKMKNNFYLELNAQKTADTSMSYLPANRAVLKNAILGDFVLNLDVMPPAQNTNPSEVCFFLGLKDSTRYYLIVLSTDQTSDPSGIYLVKNSVKTLLADSSLTETRLQTNAWQKIRIVHNIVKRTILVFVGNMTQPVLSVKDYELVIGRVGFGSLNSPVCFDNLSVWAPTMIPEEEYQQRVKSE